MAVRHGDRKGRRRGWGTGGVAVIVLLAVLAGCAPAGEMDGYLTQTEQAGVTQTAAAVVAVLAAAPTVTPSPTVTPTMTETPTPTMTPSPTITPTPTSTPLGGSSGLIAFTSSGMATRKST